MRKRRTNEKPEEAISLRAMHLHAGDSLHSSEGIRWSEGGTHPTSEASSSRVPQEQEDLREGIRARQVGAGTPNQEVALLIDGENVSSHSATEILACAQSSGEITVRRLYGNFAAPQMALWREAGWQHGLTPIHHQSPIAGKNAGDIALVVDAMQICEGGDTLLCPGVV